MKGKDKTLLAKYKPFYESGKTLSNSDTKIGYFVKSYAVNQIFSVYKTDKNSLNEGEKKEFEVMIKELAAEKTQLGPDAQCSQEDFISFLENLFSSVDDEDRNGEVTMKTSAKFKLIGDLIDILLVYGSLPDNWQKKSNLGN